MSVEFNPAPEVERIARSLISGVHAHLAEAEILYLFTNQKKKKQGKSVFATAQKLGDLDRYLTGAHHNEVEVDFIVIVCQSLWEDLTDRQRKALVDHELCHCVRDGFDNAGDPVWSVRAHDVEEFRAVIERHGFWNEDVTQFAKSVSQAELSGQLRLARMIQDLTPEQRVQLIMEAKARVQAHSGKATDAAPEPAGTAQETTHE